MFTMFHNISRKICSKCFVKYCALISSKWQHCEILVFCSYARCANSIRTSSDIAGAMYSPCNGEWMFLYGP